MAELREIFLTAALFIVFGEQITNLLSELSFPDFRRFTIRHGNVLMVDDCRGLNLKRMYTILTQVMVKAYQLVPP